jgi:hypothetical protein
LFARRRGGSSGSRCASPFFPRVLVRLVGLDVGVLQGIGVAEPEREIPELVSEPQELESVASQLAGQLRRRHALGEAAEDQHERDRPPLGAPQGRAGEGVEDAPTCPAAIVEDRGPVASVDIV